MRPSRVHFSPSAGFFFAATEPKSILAHTAHRSRQKHRHQSLNVRFADGLSDFRKRWIEGMRFGHLFPSETYRSRNIFLHKSNIRSEIAGDKLYSRREHEIYWPISFREKVDLYDSTRCIQILPLIKCAVAVSESTHFGKTPDDTIGDCVCVCAVLANAWVLLKRAMCMPCITFTRF